MKNNSKFFSALAVLVGTAIGAGYLGIPYVAAKSGFIPTLVYLIAVGLFMLVVMLYLGEVLLRTKGNHQLTGYAGRYLGKIGKVLMFLSMIFGIYSALSAYLLAEGKSLSYVILGNEGYVLLFTLIFWILMAGLSYIGLCALKQYEKYAMLGVGVILVVIALLFFGGIRLENLSYLNSSNIFLPFGIILFSFLAFSAMPEVERILLGKERLMKKTIIWGMFIPFAVYSLFTLVMLGNFGINVNEVATLSLGRIFSILAILTMFTASFVSTIAILDMFRFDFEMSRRRAWFLACSIPLILFLFIHLFDLAGFVEILSLSGVVSGGLAGILILLMNKKAKIEGNRKPEYSMPINWWIIGIMSLIFVLAVLAEFVF